MFKAVRKRFNGGFTITEMVVVTAIVLVIASILVGAYPRFKNRNTLSALARRVALGIREAQVFGLAVREFPRGFVEEDIGANFPPYGIYFNIDEDPRQMILFADINEPLGVYNSDVPCEDSSSECVQRMTFPRSESVTDICLLAGGGEPGLPPPLPTCGHSTFSVTFRRPDPEAHIRTISSDPTEYNSAEIHISSRNVPDAKKIVRVWISGQISITTEDITP